MTHRAALVLSILLTLIVGTGVLAGRDRLFAPESVTSPVSSTSSAANVPVAVPARGATTTTPRIVTVTLPSTTGGTTASARTERSERSIDRDGNEHDQDHDEGYEHDGEHDDD